MVVHGLVAEALDVELICVDDALFDACRAAAADELGRCVDVLDVDDEVIAQPMTIGAGMQARAMFSVFNSPAPELRRCTVVSLPDDAHAAVRLDDGRIVNVHPSSLLAA